MATSTGLESSSTPRSLSILGLSGQENANTDLLESETLSPRVRCEKNESQGIWSYRSPDSPKDLKRFLIDRTISDDRKAEQDVFRRAISHLNTVESSSAFFEKHVLPERPSRESSVVLVDIFEKQERDKKVDAVFHTFCLWKKTDDTWLIIDPSNHTFSGRIVGIERQIEQDPGYSIERKTHIGEKFYVKTSLRTERIPSFENKSARDCIDIAVKIGLCINFFESHSFDLETVEKRIHLISNQAKVNPQLLHGGKESEIGSLQSSIHSDREKAIYLLTENSKFIEKISEIENLTLLKELDSIRLEIFKFLREKKIEKTDFFLFVQELLGSNKVTFAQFKKDYLTWLKMLERQNSLNKEKALLKTGYEPANKPVNPQRRK